MSFNKPKKNSFENWINPDLDYAFVDFTAFNKKFPGSNEKFELRHTVYLSAAKQWLFSKPADRPPARFPCGEIFRGR